MKVLLIFYLLFSCFLYFSGVGWYHILDVVMHVDHISLIGGEDEGRGEGGEWEGRGRGKSDLAMINGRYDERRYCSSLGSICGIVKQNNNS